MRKNPVLQGPSITGRGLRRTAVARLVLAALLGGTLAVASPNDVLAAEDDVSIGMARERFKEGVQYFDQKQYDKARAAFLQAYALKRHPAVLLNLAQSELRSGHEADAAKHFAQYLREHKEASDAERQGAESGLAAAKALVGELQVNADEEGATVLVDGVAEGTTPLPGPVYLTPGGHTITARKEGRETSAQVQAAAGQSTSTTLRFKKAAPAAEPTTPPAERRDDDDDDDDRAEPPPAAAAGAESAPAEPGRGRKPFFEWVGSSPVAWIGGGLFVGGVAGGVGFGLVAKNRYDDANSINTQIENQAINVDQTNPVGICTENRLAELTVSEGVETAARYREACNLYKDKADEGDRFKSLAIISGAVAGVALVGTVVLYFITADEDEGTARAPRSRSTARVVPWASPDAGGVLVGGEF